MGYVIFLLLGRINSLTLVIVWSKIWSLGTKCSSPPIVVAMAIEKPSAVTVRSTVVTTRSVVAIILLLSTEVLWSSL